MEHIKLSVIKKVFLIVMSVVASLMIVLNISINHKDLTNHTDSKPVVFSNDFYDTSLSEPNVDPVHDVIPMENVYQILLDNLNLASKDDLTPTQIQQLDTLDSNIAQLIETATLNKWVSITTAEELYQFSNAQSINFNLQAGTNTYIYENTIKKILSLNYILLADIDYSSMRSRKFVPIGTNILLESQEIGAGGNIEIYMPFTGIFDGNGFVISNLYLADFAYITTTFQEDEGSTAVTTSLFKEYGMFAAIGETGVVKNFILRNPIYEVLLIDSSNGLFSFAMLAGHNDGTIYNVGVIDEKRTQQGNDNTGIIVNIRYPSSESYNAAGFVYHNSGKIYNSYFTSQHIIQQGSMLLFDVIAPFVYDNTGGVINGASYTSGMSVKKTIKF